MKILVTGGRGSVGRSLVVELERRHHEVWVSDLYQYHHPRYRRCDVRHIRQLRDLMCREKFDMVYHLAAEFGRHNGEDYYENLWLTNVIGTKNIITLQRELGFRLVFFSSSEVYGDYDGIMYEDVMDQHEIPQLNDYAITKWVGEMQVRNAEAEFNVDTVRVRLFNIYGPGEYYSPYRSAICVFCYKALFAQPYSVYLGHHRTSLFISDAVRSLGQIADSFHPGQVYNIGGTEYHDMKIVSDMILQYIGQSDEIVNYVESEPRTTRDKKVNTDRAERELGHKAIIGLEDGIAQTIEWMKGIYPTFDCELLGG